MHLPDSHRHWLLLHQGLYPGLLNFFINGAIAWLIMRNHETLGLWAEPAAAPDLLITGFLLPFIICLINSAMIPKSVAAGKIVPLAASDAPSGSWHRRPGWVRSLALGALGVIAGALPLIGLLEVAQLDPIPLFQFVGIKAVWAGLLAAILSPLIAWWALADPSTEGAS